MTRSVENIEPIKHPHIGFYACGPTVYDYTHIGHLRKYAMDDVLVRLLRHNGFEVVFVRNITDVGHLVSDDDTGEDKMEKGARQYGKSVWDIAKEFEAYFWRSLDLLNIIRPDVSCRATEHIQEQIDLISRLEKNGYTYIISDGVYFDTSKFPTYGELTKLNQEMILPGARVEMVVGKKHPTDFALWKFSPKDEKRQMEWPSPWGVGFPGWHIECSAMSMKYLGEQFEIHTGGIDHIPIHHTNEIAQSEAATGKHPFVKYWAHYNFLRVDGQKMSKSLKNFYTIDDVIQKGFDPMALKLFFYGAHYRSEINFTWDALAASATAYKRLVTLLHSFKTQDDRVTLSDEKLKKVNEYRARFFLSLDTDLDLPQALSIVWEVTKSNVPSMDKYELILEFDLTLGLQLQEHEANIKADEATIPSGVAELMEMRATYRAEKNFAKADELRSEIEKLGWIVEDTSSGQSIHKK